jgi:hypothetical protein
MSTDPVAELLLRKHTRYFRHQDGGIYQIIGEGHSTVDCSEYVAYMHVWPFEQKLWFRPKEEWTPERFKEIPYNDVKLAMETGTRLDAQNAVTTAKELRKGLKK